MDGRGARYTGNGRSGFDCTGLHTEDKLLPEADMYALVRNATLAVISVDEVITSREVYGLKLIYLVRRANESTLRSLQGPWKC